MKFFLKYIAPIFAIIWLARIHPLGAVVAILLCIIRCAFRSRVLSHLFAMFVHDVLLVFLKGAWRLVFQRR